MKNKFYSLIGTKIFFLLFILTLTVASVNLKYDDVEMNEAQIEEIQQVISEKELLQQELDLFHSKVKRYDVAVQSEIAKGTYDKHVVRAAQQKLLQIKMELRNIEEVVENDRWYNWKSFNEQIRFNKNRLAKKLETALL